MNLFEKCVDWLKRLGLQEYQAKAYVALLGNTDSFAPEIAKASGVPEPKIYGVLKSLEREGFLMTSVGRPKRYRAMEIESVVESLIDRYRERVKFLENGRDEMVSELKSMVGLDQGEKKEDVWMASGNKAVENEVLKLIKSVKTKFNVLLTIDDLKYLFNSNRLLNAVYSTITNKKIKGKWILPDIFSNQLEFKDFLKNMDNNKVKVIMKIMNINLKSKNIEVRFLPNEKIHITLSSKDDEAGCIILRNPYNTESIVTGIVFYSGPVSKMMEDYFISLWEKGKIINKISIKKS